MPREIRPKESLALKENKMKCPYDIPLEVYYGQLSKMWLVEDAEGKVLFFDLTEAKAKYIVTAINSREKLVNACEKAKWLYDELALSSLKEAEQK